MSHGQHTIKIDAECDELTRLLEQVSELKGDARFELVERFLGSLDSLSELCTVDVLSDSTCTRDLRVVLKPSDRFREFAATLAL
jgi:hypothetical protein